MNREHVPPEGVTHEQHYRLARVVASLVDAVRYMHEGDTSTAERCIEKAKAKMDVVTKGIVPR